MNSIIGFISAGGAVALVAILLVAAAMVALLLTRLLYVCQPSEVLVFSGRRRRRSDGKLIGYRVIRGGRALRIPLFERVHRMDLTNMIIEVRVQNAYSRGGIPLTVQGVANIKVPGEEPLLNNCLERFLGRSRAEIMKIARETLEGNLRGVLATLTPEQVNKDKESFASQLAGEAEQDLNRLGLVLDTLKIQNVSDDVGYLDAIGREISAKIRRDAKIAEAQAQAESAERKWHNTMNAELAKLNAEIEISKKENERRIADATTGRAALIAKEEADVQALLSEANAEVEMQQARIEQVRMQLQADVIRPAEAGRKESEANAKGEAAQIIEQGRAEAQVLRELAASYREAGSSGRDALLMQKLLPLLDQVSQSMGELKVDRLTFLGRGVGGESTPLAGKLVDYGEQIKAATGVDLPALLAERLGHKKGAAPSA